MALCYSDILARERVVGISEKYGFPDSLLVEKFVMRLGMHNIMAREEDGLERSHLDIMALEPAASLSWLVVATASGWFCSAVRGC